MVVKLKIEDLVEAFSDARVAQAMSAALMPSMRECLVGIVKEQLDEFNTQIKSIFAEQLLQKKRIADLEEENTLLRRRVDIMDVDSRSSTLIIRSLPETSYSEKTSGAMGPRSSGPAEQSVAPPVHVDATERTVLQLCNEDLQLNLKSSDIELSCRIKGAMAGGVRPILVKFANHKIRNAVFDERRRLKFKKEAKVFIGEHLTRVA